MWVPFGWAYMQVTLKEGHVLVIPYPNQELAGSMGHGVKAGIWEDTEHFLERGAGDSKVWIAGKEGCTAFWTA